MPPACLVHIDPDRVFQVLTNLVSNAVKFSLPGGEVGIAAQIFVPQLQCGSHESRRGDSGLATMLAASGDSRRPLRVDCPSGHGNPDRAACGHRRFPLSREEPL